MKEVSIEKARAKLGDIVDRARYSAEATLITRHGEPAALIAPVLSDESIRIIAQARVLAAQYGYNSDTGTMLAELITIIERLTEEDPDGRLKVKSKARAAEDLADRAAVLESRADPGDLVIRAQAGEPAVIDDGLIIRSLAALGEDDQQG